MAHVWRRRLPENGGAGDWADIPCPLTGPAGDPARGVPSHRASDVESSHSGEHGLAVTAQESVVEIEEETVNIVKLEAARSELAKLLEVVEESIALQEDEREQDVTAIASVALRHRRSGK